ncbi:uncharacterized protein FFMR_00546 [Fusarium fujikuroi]|nr:uncharacterized protein FFMR_00546 [Fusarium fujikuroi]
MLLSIFN